MAHQPLPGYEPLPDFPKEQPDASVRDVEELEGWSGSRTVVMESGFGSDSFDNRYNNRGMASTAVSGVEAMGNSAMYKKKGNDYDLDAFYGDSTEEEEDSSEDEETTEEEESSEEEESEEDESEEEDETGSEEESSGLSSDSEDEPIRKK